ncbi:MAG TPA: glutamyl-tRNA reductase [Planctomycetaceae bacterium]|nr:glutamyl-tRNA reductase [Planctomycetaceae bacterium]
MNLHMVGCNHHDTRIEVRGLLAFDTQQTASALNTWRTQFPETEIVLLSTCNRCELYAATNGENIISSADQLIDVLLDYRQIDRPQIEGSLFTLNGNDVVHHLYRVAASLDSMVVGESQILAQVKQAYQNAQQQGSTGPMLHELFQSALHTAKRVAGETSLHKHRISIPSVAIADLASCVFETFDNKHVLVIGAGELAEDTLRYLRDAGNAHIHVVNRHAERGQQLANKWGGQYHAWDQLWNQLVKADLAISTTSADEPVVRADDYAEFVVRERHQRPLFVLDLAVPQDFEPAVGDALGVYLYSLDDLDQACNHNRQARKAELSSAEKIVLQETECFFANLSHRAAAPVITGLRKGLERPKAAELERLYRRLPELDPMARQEIEQFADRLVNKMLHPPLKSLRDASKNGTPHNLLNALKRLFHLED